MTDHAIGNLRARRISEKRQFVQRIVCIPSATRFELNTHQERVLLIGINS